MIAGKRDAIPFRLGDAKCQETVRLADKLSVGTVEVAGFAGVQVFRKKIPHYRLSTNCVRFKLQEIAAWAEKNYCPPGRMR